VIRAQGFPAHYGDGLAARLLDGLGPYVLVVHPEPWALLRPQVTHQPLAVIQAGDLSLDHLDALAAGLPSDATAVVGLGGGSAMDTAKWLHGRRRLPLYQLPSLPSVDACFTRMTALRDGGGVRYDGDAVPEVVVVDFGLMRAAPTELVRGGIGDVLSCHTARFDWELAVRDGVNDHPWDDEAAAMSLAYLAELEEIAPLLAEDPVAADGADRFDEGVRRLMECHRDIGWRCHELGHARFEEGSEHFFAYAFEAITGRTIMHGELVALGVLVMSALQGNDPDRPRRIVDAVRMRSGLDELGVTWDEVATTLRRLAPFVEEQRLWYSFASGLRVGDAELATARRALRVA
jgi:glycerol dehydrogenase-like iron-containing ADH family enzyme